MFRRHHPATPDAPGQQVADDIGGNGAADPAGDGTRPAATAGKGKPTPKRSEAERRRRPYTAPADRKEANRRYRERDRDSRTRRMAALQRGEQWALPPRDRGPVKALARDYVDSRRRLSEFYMYGLVVLIVVLFIPSRRVQSLMPLVLMAVIAIMLVEGIFIGYRVRALAEQRLPGESTRGVRLYSAMRALQVRRLRMPRPRIKPGDSF